MSDVNFFQVLRQEPDELRLYFTFDSTSSELFPAGYSASIRQSASEPQMIRIPSGEFFMGSSNSPAKNALMTGVDRKYLSWECHQHIVDLSEYWISRYPITNAEYLFFIQETKHPIPQYWNKGRFQKEKEIILLFQLLGMMQRVIVNGYVKNSVKISDYPQKQNGKKLLVVLMKHLSTLGGINGKRVDVIPKK